MKREKYLADIDKVLIKTFKKESPNIGDKSKIRFSKELEDSGQIKKIAFDVYRVDNDPYENLWVLEDVNGVPHLVRASDDFQAEPSVMGDWVATSDHERENVTLSYKNVPVARFASKDYGFNKSDVITFKSALLERLESDNEFLKEIFAEQPISKKESLVKNFPELRKFL